MSNFVSDWIAEKIDSYISSQRSQATTEVNANIDLQSQQAQAVLQQQAAQANAQLAQTSHVVEVAALLTVGVIAVASGYVLAKK